MSYINNLREKFSPRPGGDLGSNPGPGENFSLKLLILFVWFTVCFDSDSYDKCI